MRILTKYIKSLMKYDFFSINKNNFSIKTKPPWKIMFFGVDDFSVSSLKCLNNEFNKGIFINKLEVVTSIKAKVNPVRAYAKENNLIIHGWPITLDDKFDLGIVVSFGHLIPDDIIKKFKLGMINVHASLLPRWRGAAPIIHTIANEDSKTGVTVMKIQPKKFDIGEIIAQQQIDVPRNVLMPDLYKNLAELGASLLVSSVKQLPDSLENATPQPKIGITYAPKVTSDMAKVNWTNMTARQIYALARSLHNLYPLLTTWNDMLVKLFDVALFSENKCFDKCIPGTIEYHKQSNRLLIICSDNFCVTCRKIGLIGKKPMSALDFYNGYLQKVDVNERIFK